MDEAHNLLERGREMYSAALYKESFLQMKRELKEAREQKKGRKALLEAIPDEEVLSQDSTELVNLAEPHVTSFRHGSRIYEFAPKLEKQLEKCNKELLIMKRECEECRVVEMIDSFVQALIRLHDTLDKYLDESDDNPIRKKYWIFSSKFHIF